MSELIATCMHCCGTLHEGDAPQCPSGPDVHHGKRECVSWSVRRNNSTMAFGDDEQAARADYERRAKTLHQGEVIALERRTSVDVWSQRVDVLSERVKAGGAS